MIAMPTAMHELFKHTVNDSLLSITKGLNSYSINGLDEVNAWYGVSNDQDFDNCFSCMSHTLFRGNALLHNSLNEFRLAFHKNHTSGSNVLSIGIHMRTGDSQMAAMQNVTERRILALDLKSSTGNPRSGCRTHEHMIQAVEDLATCISAFFRDVELKGPQLHVYVTGDHDVSTTSWSKHEFTSQVQVLLRSSVPFHSGRNSSNIAVSATQGNIEVLTDFLVLSDLDLFLPNCGTGTLSSFSLNIMLRRLFIPNGFEILLRHCLRVD